jgi:hypothetical protein
MAAPIKLVKMVGEMGWCALSDLYRGVITRGILRGEKELAIGVDVDGQIYGIKLARTRIDYFEGSWERHGGGAAPGSGTASATLYPSSRGQLLFGEWLEEGTIYQWWAELNIVAHFPDEGSKGIGH